MTLSETDIKCPVFKVEHVSSVNKPKRMQWTKSYDDYLMSLVERNKGKCWREIAVSMRQKFPEVKFTSKKCRARWKNCINPELFKFYLNDAEETLLVVYHSYYKNKWFKISKNFPHRHNNLLRNTFYGSIRKLILRIINRKTTLSEITPLMFFKNLYITRFIIEILSLAQVPDKRNPIVPYYICLYIREKGITRAQCEEYFMSLKTQFLALYKYHHTLQLLQPYSYENLTTEFFDKVVSIIKEEVTVQTPVTDDLLLNVFERALHLKSAPSSQLFTPTIKTAPYTPSLQLGTCPVDSSLKLPCPMESCFPYQFLQFPVVNPNIWGMYLAQKLSC